MNALVEEELQVLESIYPDCVAAAPGNSVKLEVEIELGADTLIHVVDHPSNSAASSSRPAPPDVLSLSTLPALLLDVHFPPDYPEARAPHIAALHATHDWLSPAALADLRRQLLDMFVPGEGVLYTWVEHLRSGDFLRAIGLADDASSIRLPHAQPHILAPLLTAHDARARDTAFSESSYECAVCLTARKGARCLRLDCGHVFCRSCLADGWALYIAEGDLGRVGCLDPACVKEEREASEDEVRRVVSADEAARWLWLRQRRVFEHDPQTMHCPVASCQAAVPRPADTGDDGSGWERLRTCPRCAFSFCSFCKRTWHGPLSDCPVPQSEKVVEEYVGSAEGSAARAALEQRYGAKNLARLVARWLEERANREYFAANSMGCPNCTVRVQKSHGCNHMTCAKCKTHFCYRCGQRLKPSQPYAHFSTPGLACYQQLFDQSELTAGDWQPLELFEAEFD